jgi:hypothetical protein
MKMPAGSYEHDVFISYRKTGEWPRWLRKQFLPKLEHWLGEELGRAPAFFVDYKEVPEGGTWPLYLGRGLARSKVLLPLCSRTYFSSDWCKKELAIMMAREKLLNFRTKDQPHGLIVPVIIHDGEDFRDVLRPIQPFEICELTFLNLSPTCPKAQKLEGVIKQIAIRVAQAIRLAELFNPNWEDIVCDEFMKLFDERGQRRSRTTVPSLGG